MKEMIGMMSTTKTTNSVMKDFKLGNCFKVSLFICITVLFAGNMISCSDNDDPKPICTDWRNNIKLDANGVPYIPYYKYPTREELLPAIVGHILDSTTDTPDGVSTIGFDGKITYHSPDEFMSSGSTWVIKDTETLCQEYWDTHDGPTLMTRKLHYTYNQETGIFNINNYEHMILRVMEINGNELVAIVKTGNPDAYWDMSGYQIRHYLILDQE